MASAKTPVPDGDRWSSSLTLSDLVGHLAPGYTSIGDMVYDVIKQGILGATFAPGERLRQEALAEAIGVSRIPVRSALMRLDSEGLVHFNPRRGAVVRSITVEQIGEIYELREVLEVYALRKAMPHHDGARLKELSDLARALDGEGEGRGFVDMRVAFYRKLYDAEANPQLVELIETLRGRVGRYLLGWRVSGHVGGRSHRDLIDRVASGDVQAAEEALRAHLQSVRAGIENMVEEQHRTSAHAEALR